MITNETTNTKKWYVLKTPPRTEKKIHQLLLKNDFESYLPLQRKLRNWHDRKKWIEVPLFNSYTFVNIEPKNRTKIFELYNAIKFLFIGKEIATLLESEIEKIKLLCNYNGDIEITNEVLKIGDKIEITEGFFIGEIGYLVELKGKTKFKISINGLGCSAYVEVEQQNIRKYLN
jgi:transcription antitermination factor NusG